MNKQAQDRLYMGIARRVAEESYCERGQVGAVIVTPHNGMFIGFNGTPKGFPNICEINGKTDELVIHAEQNALLKMLSEGVSPRGAVVYQTLSPCIECTKWLYSCGVHRVVYDKAYRNTEHLEVFTKMGMVFEEYVDVYES